MYQSVGPTSLTRPELDAYLANGWYRMAQTLFTLDYILMAEYVRVFWLRFRLPGFDFEKKHRDLIRKNSRFQVDILPLHLTAEHDRLYSDYRQWIDFDGPSTARAFLFEEHGPLYSNKKGIFESRMVEVRDNGKLIALGVFDLGQNATAGIMNFFHPDYQKYSPGKYLMLKKIEYSLQEGMAWYYPGYIGYRFPKFDYKLYPGASFAEIFDPVMEEWLPYSAEKVRELAESQFFSWDEAEEG